MTVPIPRIATPRLILRAPRYDDFADYAALMASPRSIGMGGPFDTRAAWGLFCNDIAQWHLFGHGSLMLETIAIGQCIGQVGVNHGPLFPEKELGWMLYKGHEGQGYALEAATAMREWAFWVFGLTQLVSYVDPDNTRSIELAGRLGAVLDNAAIGQDPEDLVYRHWRPALRV